MHPLKQGLQPPLEGLVLNALVILADEIAAVTQHVEGETEGRVAEILMFRSDNRPKVSHLDLLASGREEKKRDRDGHLPYSRRDRETHCRSCSSS